MKIVLRVLKWIVLLALAVWLWSVLFPRSEKIIRKQLARLAEAASFAGDEGAFSSANNAARLAGYFSLDAEVIFDAPIHGQQSFSGRGEIQQAALAARRALVSLAVEFVDANIAMANDKQSATVELTVKAKVKGEANFYVQAMKFTFKKINKDWLITRVETVKTLQ